MHLDVEEFLNFYTSPLGHVVAKILSKKLFDISDLDQRMKILGIGYPTPYLAPLQKYVERSIAMMPSQQGVMAWPPNAENVTLLAEDDALPLPDNYFDRVFLMHGVEFSENPKRLLNEAWRVLAPDGKLFIVVPNRKGYWASFGHTPFGHGKPYTTQQMRSLLERTNFSFIKRERALFFPPLSAPLILRAATTWEKAGTQFYRAISGLLLIEAEKNLVEILPEKSRIRILGERPVMG